jgi:hypothetical protein
MSAVSKNSLGNIDQYIKMAGTLAQEYERNSKAAVDAKNTNDPSKMATAQAQLDFSEIKFKNFMGTLKKTLDLMKEIISMFSSR